MKKILVATMLLAGVVQAKNFEGTVQYQTTNPEGKAGPLMEMSIKGGKMRVETEVSGHHSVNIMDMKARRMTMLMPDQKKYMVHDMPEPKADASASKGKLSKTGKSETIAGYKAEEWVYTTDKGTKFSLWGSTELGSMVDGMGQGGQGHGGFEIPAELKEKGFFPLRMEMGKGGKMEAVSVKPGSLSASLFEVPSGYAEMKGFSGGGAGMKGGEAEGMPADAKARMEEAMKNMSPEQRKMMEKMMKNMGH